MRATPAVAPELARARARAAVVLVAIRDLGIDGPGSGRIVGPLINRHHGLMRRLDAASGELNARNYVAAHRKAHGVYLDLGVLAEVVAAAAVRPAAAPTPRRGGPTAAVASTGHTGPAEGTRGRAPRPSATPSASGSAYDRSVCAIVDSSTIVPCNYVPDHSTSTETK